MNTGVVQQYVTPTRYLSTPVDMMLITKDCQLFDQQKGVCSHRYRVFHRRLHQQLIGQDIKLADMDGITGMLRTGIARYSLW